MNFFIAVIFAVVNGSPQMAMSNVMYQSVEQCRAALVRSADRLDADDSVQTYHGKCFQIKANTV